MFRKRNMKTGFLCLVFIYRMCILTQKSIVKIHCRDVAVEDNAFNDSVNIYYTEKNSRS